MRTLKLTIAYDGTDFAGWQVQRREPTIQGALEQALRVILGEPVAVIGSGRTDAGVHARGQVAHIRTRSRIPAERLRRALNSRVPPSIVVTKLQDAPPDFHARFDVVGKRYHYHLATGPVVLPFHRRYVHHVRAPLSLARMRREAGALRGRHDLRGFQKSGRPVGNTRRTLSRARIIERPRGFLTVELVGDGFLYGMARSIVGTLIDVGRGHRPPGTIARVLRTGDRRLAGPAAPAKGLCLVDVRYRPRSLLIRTPGAGPAAAPPRRARGTPIPLRQFLTSWKGRVGPSPAARGGAPLRVTRPPRARTSSRLASRG